MFFAFYFVSLLWISSNQFCCKQIAIAKSLNANCIISAEKLVKISLAKPCAEWSLARLWAFVTQNKRFCWLWPLWWFISRTAVLDTRPKRIALKISCHLAFSNSLNFPRGSLIALSIKEMLFRKKLTAKLNAQSNSIRATVLLSWLCNFRDIKVYYNSVKSCMEVNDFLMSWYSIHRTRFISLSTW